MPEIETLKVGWYLWMACSRDDTGKAACIRLGFTENQARRRTLVAYNKFWSL